MDDRRNNAHYNQNFLYTINPSHKNTKIKNIIRLEKYAGDWRDGVKTGFGIIEIEKYAHREINLFSNQNSPQTAVVETAFYEGCWKKGVYDGWVGSTFLDAINLIRWTVVFGREYRYA